MTDISKPINIGTLVTFKDNIPYCGMWRIARTQVTGTYQYYIHLERITPLNDNTPKYHRMSEMVYRWRTNEIA